MTTQKKTNLTVGNLLSADHKLVLKQLAELQSAIETAKDKPDAEKATNILKTIKKEMNLHFGKEEEILFPALNHYFEKALKKIGGKIRPESPVKVMLLEHKALRMITQNLENTLERHDMNETSTNMTKFTELIKSHIFREENVLYVVADAKLTQKDKQKLKQALSRFQ